MGLFKPSKQQKEKKAFRKILAEKKTLAARQAYSDEAVKVAAERAKAKARRPSFGEMIRARARGSVERRISGRRVAPARRTPVRRRTVYKRIAPRRRVTYRRTPVKRRRTIYRRTPVRRKSPRRIKPQAPRQPQSLGQAIYGGY